MATKRLGIHEWLMSITKAVSKRSNCVSRKVGCVLVDKHNHILSTGMNGVPSGIDHCALCHRKTPGRDLESCLSVHAEANALLQCPDVNKIVTAYITVNPCNICMRMLANTSCRTIVYKEAYTPESLIEFTRFWQGRLRRTIVKVK